MPVVVGKNKLFVGSSLADKKLCSAQDVNIVLKLYITITKINSHEKTKAPAMGSNALLLPARLGTNENNFRKSY